MSLDFKEQARETMSAPTVTVVVPTHARPVQIEACLDGLSRLDPVPGGFEIVIVDDGSPRSIETLIAAWRDRLPIRLIVRARGGPAKARNDGAEMARGRYLAFIDDDCIPLPGWLSALVRELERRPDFLLGGPVSNGLPDNPYATATQSITTYAQHYYRSKGGNEPFFTTNNLAVSKERFHHVGGFNTSIRSGTGEDREFCDRWLSYNFPMANVPDAEVIHSHPLTLRRFLRQHFNYGRGILAVRLIRRRREPSGFVPEPVSFYWNLILFPLRDRGRNHVWRDVALMIAAQLATIVGFFSAALIDLPGQRAALRSDNSGAVKRSVLADESDKARRD